MIDDAAADLGQPVDVRFACPVVAPFYRVVEEPVDTVPVVRVVLRSVDPPLSRNAVSAARRLVITERRDLVSQFGQRCRGGCARQPRAHNNDMALALVRRINKVQMEPVVVPLFFEGTIRNFCIQDHDYRALAQ